MQDGSLIMLAFMAVGFIAVVLGYFTRVGSGINPRAYGKLYSGSPGARGEAQLSGHDPQRAPVREWLRGCR